MREKLNKAIDCQQACEIPQGVTLVRVPPPRHAWTDIIRCPDCGDCFLVEREETGRAALNEARDADQESRNDR